MNKIIIRILTIISILIIVCGACAGIGIKNELTDNGEKIEGAWVDGTDFSPVLNFVREIGSGFLSFLIISYSVAIVTAIWIIYGIIFLIVQIINKCRLHRHK